jgi:gliding motility-associated-like protein
LLIVLVLSVTILNAQLTSNISPVTGTTANDDVFIFCTNGPGSADGLLTATSRTGVSSTFSWEVYDTISAGFVPFDAIVSYEDTLKQTIIRLENGLYRVTINSGGTVINYQAWVLNNWIEITRTEIPDSSSTCEGFQIWADYTYAPLYYYNIQTNERRPIRRINKPFDFKWYRDGEWVFSSLNPYSLPIPSKDPIKHQLTVIDQFGCQSPSGQGAVDYYSKVPKSDFTADPLTGEAVLRVTFTNKSFNYDSILWCFYKDNNIIKREIEENDGQMVDSIDFVLLENAPVYEYEWAGEYKVKVVTVKVNPTTGNCYDTLYMKPGEFINVDTALVEAPNVFTPNGDGVNDVFAVKTQSLKSMSIHIYNRWGGLVHSWSYSNIRGRDYTYEHSVWDGKIGGRMASPGVYFYVISVVRRDDKPTKPKQGFVHLFRNKN